MLYVTWMLSVLLASSFAIIGALYLENTDNAAD